MTDVDNLLARLDDKHKWLTIPTHNVIEMVSEAAAVIRALRAGREWRPIDSAPRDGTEILIYANGMSIQAWFCKGEWSSDTPAYPAEYDGAIWCAFDDAIQFEVEETPFGFHDGTVTHWQPLPEGPAS